MVPPQVGAITLTRPPTPCKPAPAPRSWAWLDGDRAAGRASGGNCKASVEVALPTSARSDPSGTVHRRSPTHIRSGHERSRPVVDDGAQSLKAWDVVNQAVPREWGRNGADEMTSGGSQRV